MLAQLLRGAVEEVRVVQHPAERRVGAHRDEILVEEQVAHGLDPQGPREPRYVAVPERAVHRDHQARDRLERVGQVLARPVGHPRLRRDGVELGAPSRDRVPDTGLEDPAERHGSDGVSIMPQRATCHGTVVLDRAA